MRTISKIHSYLYRLKTFLNACHKKQVDWDFFQYVVFVTFFQLTSSKPVQITDYFASGVSTGFPNTYKKHEKDWFLFIK